MTRSRMPHDTWIDAEEKAYNVSLRQSPRRFRALFEGPSGKWEHVEGRAGIPDTYFSIPAMVGNVLGYLSIVGDFVRGPSGQLDDHAYAGAMEWRATPKRGQRTRRNPRLSGVRSIGPNMTEADHGDLGILYSYRTPVAILAPSGLYRTSTHHSNTTARQISKWGRLHGLDTKGAKRISQNAIEWAATNGVDPAETVDLPTTSHSGGEHEFKSNPGKFADTIEEMLYGTDHDQTMGEADGPLGWMGLVSGMTIREAREVAEMLGIELDKSDIDDYDWPLNAIIIENDQGFIDVTTYKSNRDVIRVWRELEKELEGFETGEE